MKVALVHDDFMQFGGAERLVFEMSRVWPSAPIYTACFDPRVLPSDFPCERLVPSFIQRIPFQRQLYRQLFFLHPLAFEQFNFNEYDVVMSSTTRFAKSVITQPQTKHICYCNTPPRFLWFTRKYLSNKRFSSVLGNIYKVLLNPLLSYLRLHDYVAAQRVDQFVANSQNVACRLRKFYHRGSKVIYPFVELQRFDDYRGQHYAGSTYSKEHSLVHFTRGREQNVPNLEDLDQGYYLIVSRLGGHKRIDLAIEAFNRLGWLLKIVGDGPERKKLQAAARPNIEFLGRVSDQKVVEYYFNCRAFIYPQEEDFGITALEAQAAGKPVVAFKAGGALETVVEGKTGFFFAPQTAKALVSCLRELQGSQALERINPQNCIDNARGFSKEKFVEMMQGLVES